MLQGKRSAALAILVLICAFAALGCGGPKTSPEESIRVYANMGVKFDFSEAEKIGITGENLKKAQALKAENLDTETRRLFTSARTNADDATVEKFKDIIVKVSQKAEIKTELVSKADKTATVKVALRAPDLRAFMQQSLVPAIQKKANDPQGEWAAEGAAFIVSLYEQALDTMPLKAEPATFEVKCIVDEKTNCWRPENPENFKRQILAASNGEA